jgi:DNA-directed RNA polymerase subunit RPC12/RpoP
MQKRKTGDMKCWNCGKWISKTGNLCPYCNKNKQQSRQLVENREDWFMTRSALWLVISLGLAGASAWAASSLPVFCAAGLLLFLPGFMLVYFWAGMAGA